MTSLAHQLKRLALPQTDSALLSRRETASLLFDPKDAATMEQSTFYALGCTGLEELLGIEPSFQEFQHTLFSRAALTLERSVQSRDVNAKLDEGIALFLTRLSPYVLLRPAHKCLEWLLHRFHVHMFNVDALLACVLPYHDTKVFVRVLQLLKVQEPTDRWNWLLPVQKGGVALSRSALVTHVCSDLGFLDFLCTMVTRSVQAYPGHSGSCPQLRVVFSFYASTVVSALDSVDSVSESFVSKLLPYVQRGLKSSLGDFKAASYMLVCQLAVKVLMEAGLVESLAVQVSRSLLREPVLAKEGLGSLVVLLQNQKTSVVGPKAFSRLTAMPTLASTLENMAALHDVTPLLRPLLPYLLQRVFSSGQSRGEADEEADHLGPLESILQRVPLTKDLDQTLARLFLDLYLSQTDLSAEDLSALDQRLLPLIRLFESRYSEALEKVLSTFVSGDEKTLFHRFLSLSMSSGKFQILSDSDTSLILSLKHPLPSVRVSALERLLELMTSEQNLDQDFLEAAVKERLEDEVPEVVTSALRVLEAQLDGLDPEGIVVCLLSLLLRVEESDAEQWLPVLTEAVRLLSDPRLGKGDAERQQRIGWKLLPFLVVTRGGSGLAAAVARCSVIARHPLTVSWTEEMDAVLKKSAVHDFVGLANERLVATLTRNLKNMENFYRQEALEKLALLVEQQRGSAPRERVAALVLTRTLVLSLDQLSHTQHLLTAQRVYCLLERPLLELRRRADAQEVKLPSTLPSSFSEALTLYVGESERRRRPSDRLDAEFSLVLAALLQDFSSALQCHDASFKAERWWNPEKMDANTCCYLGLLCRLFLLAVSGAAEGPAAGIFRTLIKVLVQVHLPEQMWLFRFLSVLWGYGSNHGDQLDVKMDAVLQTRALCVGGALLSVQPVATLQQLSAADSPVIPSLLCCLTSRVREVRRAGLAALQSLSGVGVSPFQPMVEKLLMTSEEILADPAYLSSAMAALQAESSSSRRETPQLLLRSVQTPCCPSYTAAALLQALHEVNGEPVLSAVLPVLERLLELSGPDTPAPLRSEALLSQLVVGKFNEASAAMLARDQNCLDLFVRALRSPAHPHPDLPSLQISALEQITKGFFSGLGDQKVQQKLLNVMFDLLLENQLPLVANTISSVFKRIAVDAQLIAEELSPPEKQRVSGTVQQTRRSRMALKKLQDSGEVCPEEGAVPWQRVTLILELLQHKKKLKGPEALVPVLFSLLARSMEPGLGEDTNLEYTKQLLLSCLLNICQKVSPEGGVPAPDVLGDDKFSVELLVQCIRTSDVPQTHHHALLLLGAAAAIFPEKVLHNIMPIFTFMGANVLRLDDSYSFRVIDKTVQTVIPALIKAHPLSDGGQSSAQMLAVVTRIVHVFADALPHVPDHRRLPVLVRLMTTLGPAHFLWVLLLLLFKLHAVQVSSSAQEKDAALERDLDFWIHLCCQFEVCDIISSIISVLRFLQTLPHDKDADSHGTSRGRRGAQKDEETAEQLIFNVDAHSSKDLRHFHFLSVSFTAQLLASNTFIAKVSDVTEDESLQQLQQSLLQEVLLSINAVARSVERHVDKPSWKFWRVLLNKSYDVLDKVNALLPPHTFITVVKGLMGNELPSVRRKAVELLNNKLQQRTQWEEPQVPLLLQLTTDLLSIVGNKEAEPDVNRQTALYGLKLLCRSFGSAHPEPFGPVLLRALDVLQREDEERNVAGSALLCSAEVVWALKARAIPHLPRLMPRLLHALTDRKETAANQIYLLSAVTAVQRVSEALPHFISPYLQDITLQLCRLSLEETSSSTSSSCAQLSLRVSALRKTLANQIPPRVLVPALCSCYSLLTSEQLGALMSLLQEHIGHMTNDQLSVHQSELSSFFLTALDFRAQHCQADLEDVSVVEGHVMDCVLSMVLKLSEVSFRPLFFRLFDWSKSGAKDRLLTFYRLCDRLAERLKGLFVLFAGQLIQPFCELLQQNHSASTEEPLFPRADKRSLLLQLVLDCLHKIFLFHCQHFLSPERASALLTPLVQQLENTVGGASIYQQRVLRHLIPCVSQFSLLLNDDAVKTLNAEVLQRTRHADSQVRFSALLVLMELASKLKENYVVLLPETIPFLAELMEDECEEVELQVQKVVQEMEKVLGEPLQSYF